MLNTHLRIEYAVLPVHCIPFCPLSRHIYFCGSEILYQM